MIRFFDSNYTPAQVKMLLGLIIDAGAQVQRESECDCSSECGDCPYSQLCADLDRLKAYLKVLDKTGKIGKKGGDK